MKLNQDTKDKPKSSEYSFDIKKIPDFQLLEIYERQDKIIRNKNLFNKLPDKGKKLLEKNKLIENELEFRKKATDDIVTSIRELKIDCEQSKDSHKEESDSSSLSPSSLSIQERLPSIQPQVSITKSTPPVQMEKFAVSRSTRIDQVAPAQRFIPALSNITKQDHKDKDAMRVPLTEVVKLKGRETVYLKELELKEAQEKLNSLEFGATSASVGGIGSLSYTPMSYRSSHEGEESEEEEGEEREEEGDEEERGGTISYTVHE